DRHRLRCLQPHQARQVISACSAATGQGDPAPFFVGENLMIGYIIIVGVLGAVWLAYEGV
ncbi:hypothetical protein, partial [Xanthomonas citri]|uniref:hypothetical protein n=1 Tax=Xanthomonas citri TaxID=346 RepID=UPI001CC15BC6